MDHVPYHVSVPPLPPLLVVPPAQSVRGRLDNTALSSGKYISPSVIVAEICISEI